MKGRTMVRVSEAHSRLSRRRSGRVLLLSVVAAVGIAVAAGISGAATLKQTQVNSTLNWAIQTNPPSMFNAFYFGTEGSTIFSLTAHRILAPGVFGQPTTGPEAAVASWRAVNPRTYVYRVKQGLRFSDGTPLRASDVAFSLNVHKNEKTGSRMFSFFSNVASITSNNRAGTVTVRLKKADSNWQYTPAGAPSIVYSQADYRKKGASFGTPSGLPVSSGPYKYVEYSPNNRVVLERNTFWRGKRYPWNRIVFPVIPDANARLLALQSGQIDGTFAVPNNDIPLWIKTPNMKVGTFNSGGFRGFSIDIEDGPFKDINVRRALAHSLDKASITEALTSSRGQVLDGLPPLLFLRPYLSKAEIDRGLRQVRKYPYSIDRARAELQQSAYPRGFETTLNVPTGCPACLLLSQVLQQGASRIGIEIKLNIMPGPQRFQVILDHKPNLGIQVLGQGAGSPHPMDKPDLLYKSSKAAPGFENSANYKNPQVDRLIDEALASSDLKVAARNALTIMQAVARDVPYIPIFSIPGAWAVEDGWRFRSSIGPFYYNQVWLNHLITG
jgi:peptide/nickel transport system substrate-binding protein